MGTLSLRGIRLHITQWAAILILTSPFVPAGSGEEVFKVSHSPKHPKSGEEVTITISAARGAAKGDLLLQYQVVEPGKYIALGDPAFETEWTNVELTNAVELQ